MNNDKLLHLNIGQNIIGDNGVRLISEGLQYNNTLTKLDAYRCGFLLEGMHTYIGICIGRMIILHVLMFIRTYQQYNYVASYVYTHTYCIAGKFCQ